MTVFPDIDNNEHYSEFSKLDEFEEEECSENSVLSDNTYAEYIYNEISIFLENIIT